MSVAGLSVGVDKNVGLFLPSGESDKALVESVFKTDNDPAWIGLLPFSQEFCQALVAPHLARDQDHCPLAVGEDI